MKSKLAPIATLFLLSLNTQAQENTSIEKLHDVIDVFKAAFFDTTKEQQFYNLFLHDSITWAAVYEGKTKEQFKAKEDHEPLFSGTFRSFYQWIKKGNYKENFYNIVVNLDNNHATVTFDYTFNKNDEIENWGKEYWTLLKVEDNWKIASVLWTFNYQNIEACPFTNSSYYRE